MGEVRPIGGLARVLRTAAPGAVWLMLMAGCAQVPPKASPGHIQKAEEPRIEGAIPAPVQLAPVLPPPSATQRPETYSVVVNNVRVQDLLFALARDAKVNVDIHPSVTGTVTLNAIDQTLTQLLHRISKQVDMRYEIEGQNLFVTRDTPYLKTYRIDYLGLRRNFTSQVSVASQVTSGIAATGGAGASSAQNNSTAVIKSDLDNQFWSSLVNNIRELLRDTDRIVPVSSQPAATPQQQPSAGTANAPSAATPPAPPVQQTEFREAASVIANAESGVLSVRATSRQHERVQEFLDGVLATAKKQVLIEATIAEVQLNNQYQRGIDWSRLRNGTTGFQFQQSSATFPFLVNPTTSSSFVFGFASPGANFTSAIRLLETFGDVRVLSSPKLSVLNNQPAVLKVTDNIVYFVVAASTTTSANVAAVTTINTTPQTVPVGFVMTVIPQINDADTVSMTVRPSITRLLRFVPDPNPSLGAIQNLVPETQTREMESVLRIQSGQIAVLGGLIQDSVNNLEDSIPGVRTIPGIGQLLSQRRDTSAKSELVIFIRPVVVRDASIEGDLQQFRSFVPGGDFFLKPNPARQPN